METALRHEGGLVWLARAAFCAALLGAVAEALLPDRLHIRPPWDKAGHFMVFYGLTVLAMAGFPRIRMAWLMIALAACGGAIELGQAMPMIHRDGDVGDFAADCLGVIFAVAPAIAWVVRSRGDAMARRAPAGS